MAHAMRIDTLEASGLLQKAGMEKDQADAIVNVLTKVDTTDLATKSDLTREISDVKTEISDVKSDLKWIKIIGGTIVGLLILPYLGQAFGLN